jgi:hypothetical protein
MDSDAHPRSSVLEEIQADDGRPVLFTGARLLTGDPLIGTLDGDVLVGGGVIVGVGPGLLTAAGDDGMIVVDVTGATIIPVVVDGLAFAGSRSTRADGVGTLTPGNPADLLVVPDVYAPDAGTALTTLLTRPQDVLAAVADGRIVRWHGREVQPGQTHHSGGTPSPAPAPAPDRVGVWVDRTGFLHQDLTAVGRYDETRGGRPHAFGGRYWIDGDRIDYLDDLGFWAFGEFRGDELHHAGYVMRRS